MTAEHALAEELTSSLTESDYQHIAEARAELATYYTTQNVDGEEIVFRSFARRAASAAGASAAAGLGLVLSFTSLVHS